METRAGDASPGTGRVSLRDVGTVPLVRTLGEKLSQLARKEVELAREEARADLKRGMMAGGLAGGAMFAAMAALVCGLFAALTALGHVLPPIWVALAGMAVFGLVALAAGWAATAEGREVKPERSIRQAQETFKMLRDLRPGSPAWGHGAPRSEGRAT